MDKKNEEENRYKDIFMKRLRPPQGYDNWLDYAIDTMDTRREYNERLWAVENTTREDMREAAKQELKELRNAIKA
jgi:NADH:ubiquinone oxidoreductase subunit